MTQLAIKGGKVGFLDTRYYATGTAVKLELLEPGGRKKTTVD